MPLPLAMAFISKPRPGNLTKMASALLQYVGWQCAGGGAGRAGLSQSSKLGEWDGTDRWPGRFPLLACASFALQEGQIWHALGERGRFWIDEAWFFWVTFYQIAVLAVEKKAWLQKVILFLLLFACHICYFPSPSFLLTFHGILSAVLLLVRRTLCWPSECPEASLNLSSIRHSAKPCFTTQ